MGIYRGAGGSGDAVNDASSEALITIQARDAALAAQAAAEAAQAAAELAETNAETAETNAETAETNAETAATNAASSASAASTSASNAASSASAASTSASNASTSASNAASSASAASTSASNAASSASTATTQATNASNSASAASTSATNASNSASAAATSATNAANSATAAQTAQTAAELAETNAETAEANAETAETNAAASASAAATSASNASTSASNAATSATNASNSASAAATSATNASNSASAASTSATNASNSATSAANSATAAAASYDSFDDRYLGAKSSAPTLDNDGNTLLTGALYYDTVSSSMKVWSGSAWLDAYASLSGALLATNNLSDLNNTATARTNLGVAIGTDVQAYDADTAKLDVAQSWSAAQSFNAGVTLGDASGDAFTINSSAVSIPNGLNFDSNTLVIDATNNRVGIGTSSPATNLQVSAGESRLRLTATNASGNSWELVSGGGGITGAGFFSLYDVANASQRVVVASGSGEAMRITSTGNVGIGTSSPSTKLDVSGIVTSRGSGNAARFSTVDTDVGGATILVNAAFAGAGTPAIQTQTNHPILFATNNTERMRITSSGSVGIGTSTPNDKLDVNGTDAFIRIDRSNGEPGITMRYAGSTTNRGDIAVTTGGALYFTAGGSTERMRIDSSGNVGIGTTAIFDSAGRVLTVNGTGSSRIEMGTGGATRGGLYTGGTELNLYSAGAIPLNLGTNYSTRMTIDSSGNVGINTTSPGVKLGVVDTSAGTITFPAIFGNRGTTNSTEVFLGLQTYDSGTAGITNGISSVTTSNSSGAGSADLKFWTTNAATRAERMRITSAGEVLIGTTTSNGFKFKVSDGGAAEFAFFPNDTGVNSLVSYNRSTAAYFPFQINSLDTRFLTGGTERMRITSAGDLQFNSGYGSVATAYGCRAWVNFNGTGTVAIRASGNVSSITDNGTGDYTINLTNAMPDVNYGAIGMSQAAIGTAYNRNMAGPCYSAPTTTTFRVQCSDAGTKEDPTFAHISFYR